MKLSTLANLISSGQSSLMFQLLKTSNEFYRACFISTAISEKIYDNFINGKTNLEQLCGKLAIDSNHEGLRSWLELGVSLGELRRIKDEYQITGKLSRALINPNNQAYRAGLEEIVKYHYKYITKTPGMTKERKWFPFDESAGELIAESSRLSEPFIFEAVDAAVPRKGHFNLLEVGCGAGIYIKRACARNPVLNAVGIELQAKVADLARNNIKFWGLEDRVSIEHCDVKNYSSGRKFDLITLHQNIYYFSVKDRLKLARHLIDQLKPGGQVLVTTICQGGGPGVQALNIWVSTSDGHGPLPYPDELCQQLKQAGFADIKRQRLIPFESFWAFIASKPR